MSLRDAVWILKCNDDIKEEIIRQLSDILPESPLVSDEPNSGLNIIVGTSQTSPMIRESVEKNLIDTIGPGPDDHVIKRITLDKLDCVIIAGNTEKAALYGVFSFLEELGFYFLAAKTIYPENRFAVPVGDIDKSFSTKNKWRGMFVSFCMVSTSVMSLADFRRLLSNMLRMKLNRLVFYPFENEPLIDYTYKGERKIVGDISRPESGYFSYGRHWTGSFNTDEISVGREHFEQRKRVAPMEFQNVHSSDEALDTAAQFLNRIIKEASESQIGIWLAFLPQFVSMNMTKYLRPMPRKNLHWSALVSCTDPAVKEMNAARIKSIIESYPGLEGVFVGIPEGFYEDPYTESREYIDEQMPAYADALRLQKKYWGDHWPGEELQKKHIEADIAFAKVAIEALEELEKYKPSVQTGLITVCKAYLLTKLDKILPTDVAFCDIESRSLWTHDGAPLFLFSDMKDRECAIIPRITDDGSQAGMQFNLGLYHKDGYCRSTEENGTDGLMMQTLFINGADHNIKYLAQGLWNTDINPDQFYNDYLKKIYGDRSGTEILEAYKILEANEEFMGGRGAANMPWNHVPPEIAVMRSFKDFNNPLHECPLGKDFLDNSKQRAEIYRQTVDSLEKAADIFEKVRISCSSAGSRECTYMATRTKAYAAHLRTMVMLSEIYVMYSNAFTGDIKVNLKHLTVKCRFACDSAVKTAQLFSDCVNHTTDLAPLWMVNSSMVRGTEVLYRFLSNTLSFYEGREYWSEVRWSDLFGECPYPAHGIRIDPISDNSMDEPG